VRIRPLRGSSALIAVLLASAASLAAVSSAAAVNPPATDPSADVHAFGSSGFAGDPRDLELSAPIVAIAVTSSGNGYWLAAEDGGVFVYGDAAYLGSMGSVALNRPIVGMAATPSGNGYWLVASDGGVFTFGDAGYHGSTGNIALNKPVVGMASTPSGAGYWLVASDGGIFTFGDAPYLGSTGAITLNQPVVGMASTPSGAGYWLVASDGGIFTFGDAPYLGSTGAITLNQPVVGMASTPSGAGYWLVAADGGIFTFGGAGYFGSAASVVREEPVVGMAAAPDGAGYLMTRAAGPTWPLTGTATRAVTDRPALAVKIDNHSFARGQWGLNQADVVVEELVEGGLTRFIAIFHSADVAIVGPVRSARESDVEILPMLGPTLLAYSGGNNTVRGIVDAHPAIMGIDPSAEFGSAFYRTSQRTGPHNLLSSTAGLWAFAPDEFGPPVAPFQYMLPGESLTTSAVSAPEVTVSFGSVTASWEWNGLTFVRSHSGRRHVDSSFAQVWSNNVVVLETPYETSGATGSPIARVVGSGAAYVFVDGQMVQGIWSRASTAQSWSFTDLAGQPIELRPGRTWVELAPTGSITFG
jgi:hypothetical protein